MLKKIIIILLAAVFAFTAFPMAAEGQNEKEALLQEYTEEAEAAEKYFNVPVRAGIINSVNIRKDGLGIVFQPISSTLAKMSLKALTFLADLKEIRVFLEDGRSIGVPAVVKILDNEAGTFIELNVTLSGASAIAELITNRNEVKTISFIHNDQSRTDMTTEELNKTLSSITGKAVDFTKQAAEAAAAFWKNLSDGAGAFAADTRSTAEGTITRAGEFIKGVWDSAGKALSEAVSKTGDTMENALEAAKGVFRNAAVFIFRLWRGIAGK